MSGSGIGERVQGLSSEKLDLLLRRVQKKISGDGRAAPKKNAFRIEDGGNFRMEVRKPGIFESAAFRNCPRVPPGVGEVEIEVYAASVNFRDVMIALGNYPVLSDIPALGVDCAGKIVAVGAGVGDFKIGEEVFGMTRACMGAFTGFTNTYSMCLMRKPAGWSFEQAAAIPGVFATAYYALHFVAGLRKVERVLIHCASGGVGLAAIQVAQWLGAEIFATAGTPEKRAFVHGLGVEHVMDSRSLAFIEETRKLTANQGVDVILNSLAGDAINQGLEILRPLGRFIEIGKRDIMENRQVGLRAFAHGLSLASIDLGFMSPDGRPELTERLFSELDGHFGRGVFRPLPVTTFGITDAPAAFKYMSAGTHIGKIVLTVKGRQILVDAD
jgi:phthiocerol/phenolphthiocerol synthesis type-I polyketide synthase C